MKDYQSPKQTREVSEFIRDASIQCYSFGCDMHVISDCFNSVDLGLS